MTANGTIHFQEKSITLAANEGADISVTANYLSCTGATNGFKLAIDDSAASDFKLGRKIKTEMFFRKVRFENPNASPITITYIVGIGDAEDSASVVDGEINTRSGDNVETPNAINVTNAAAVSIVAADTETTRLHLCNNSTTATDIIYYGDAGVTAADGMPITAGEKIFFETGAEIFAISNNAGGVDLRIFKEKV